MSPPGDIYLTDGTGAPRPAFSGRVARGWGGPATGEGRARAESRPAPRSHPRGVGLSDPTGREKKCPSGRCRWRSTGHGSDASPGRDAGAASPVGDALDVVAAVPAHERPVLRRPGATATERRTGSWPL